MFTEEYIVVVGPPALPLPPTQLPGIIFLEWQQNLWRIQNSPELTITTYPGALYRFDAPQGQYPIVYTCASQIGTFAEVYRERARRLGEHEGGRYLVQFICRAPLWLLDLHDVRLLSQLGLDERISVGDDYATCQAWALALYQRFPELCGIRYRARKAGGSVSNVALFGDRCADRLQIDPHDPPRQLADLRNVVLRAADYYNLVVKFPFRT